MSERTRGSNHHRSMASLSFLTAARLVSYLMSLAAPLALSLLTTLFPKVKTIYVAD